MLKTVLVAYDGSESADRAFQFALELAQPVQARVHVLALAQATGGLRPLEMAGFLETADERLDRALADMRNRAAVDSTILNAGSTVSRSAREIIHEATEQKADLVVMGHGRRSRIAQRLFGSAPKRVVSRAPCNVAVVR